MTAPPPGSPFTLTPGTVLRLLAAAAVLVFLVFLVSATFREPLEAAATRLVERGGLVGLMALVVVCDPIPGPGFQPGLVIGTSAGVPPILLFVATLAGSLLSSVLSWLGGRALRHNRGLLRLLELTGVGALLDRWRWRAVVVASLLPLPWVLVTFGAGARGMPFEHFLPAASARSLKILVSLVAIQIGWHLAA